MGQAKKRGTFEQRKQESIELKKVDEEKKQKELQEYFNSLTDEEKEELKLSRRKSKMAFAQMLALVYGSQIS